MSHPFGDLLRQHLHRRHGLSQAKLADAIDQPPHIITLMCQGQRLMGKQARERIVAIISWLYQQRVLTTLDEANALLGAAGLSSLNVRQPDEVRLLRVLVEQAAPAVVPQSARTVPSGPRSNLPLPTSSFIGRQHEVEELKNVLTAHRLVTLTGTGGVGKSRLALQVGMEVHERFADGVWLVELAALMDPAHVIQAVAHVLQIQEQPDHPLSQVLLRALHAKNCLLLLDNCEHLIEACASFAEHVVQHCPDIWILATSRELLRIPAEMAWQVKPLSVPDAEYVVQNAAQAVNAFESVRLFAERAAGAQPAFTVTEQNMAQVLQICKHLDGIPLAIELAAARLLGLPLEHLVARLQDQFRLLTGGNRTALPRHQTLRACIEWSYGLLSVPERIVFHRLAVFTGGWTLEAAETVCSGKGIEEGDILDIMVQLVQKSLVVLDAQAEHPRYSMLETLRQYAREKLNESGEFKEVANQHRDWYLALTEHVEARLYGHEQAAWMQRLEVEHDNVRAALKWTQEQGETELGLQFVAALSSFWDIRGYWSERQAWLDVFLQTDTHSAGMMESRTRPSALTVRAKVLAKSGYLAGQQGNSTRAVELLQESLALARQLNDQHGAAYALWTLGWVLRNQGQTAQAIAYSQESLALYRALEDRLGIARVLNILSSLAWIQGDYPTAKAHAQQSLALFQSVGDRTEVAIVYSQLGHLHRDQGQYREALSYYKEILSISRDTDDKTMIAWALTYLGNVTTLQGDAAQSHAYLEESLVIFQEVGERRGIALALMHLSRVARLQGQLEQAARLGEESLQRCRLLDDSGALGYALLNLGEVMYVQGNYNLATTLYIEALTCNTYEGYKFGCIQCFERLAEVAAAQAD